MRFVDSNVFVYHMAADPKFGRQASTIIRRIEDGEEATLSTLVISQVCGYLKWRRRPDAIGDFLDFLRSVPTLAKEDTNYLDFVAAGAQSGGDSIEWKMWDDLVIAAQMRRLNIREIYSNDADFDLIPDVRRVFE